MTTVYISVPVNPPQMYMNKGNSWKDNIICNNIYEPKMYCKNYALNLQLLCYLPFLGL